MSLQIQLNQPHLMQTWEADLVTFVAIMHSTKHLTLHSDKPRLTLFQGEEIWLSSKKANKFIIHEDFAIALFQGELNMVQLGRNE